MTPQSWFIVTNTDNLKFFYDCCLITDRQAFPENSYMHDMQAERPTGYLPLFTEDNLTAAFAAAKSEDDNLTTCLLEIDANSIRFGAFFGQPKGSLSDQYEKVTDQSLDCFDGHEVLLPAPLPLTCLKSIVLEDAKNQKRLVKEFSNDFGECSTKLFKSNGKLFKKAKAEAKDENSLGLRGSDADAEVSVDNATISLESFEPRYINYKKLFAYGGALSLSFYQTKNGHYSSSLFESLSSLQLDGDGCSQLKPLLSWALSDSDESGDDLTNLYCAIFDLVSGENDFGTIRYKLLTLFENKVNLPPKYAVDVSGTAIRLRQLVDRTYEADIETYFAKLIAAFDSQENRESRGEGYYKVFMLCSMLFARDNPQTALLFYHQKFKEEDYFLIAVLFGLILGVRATPLRVSKINGLAEWVSFNMAKLAQSCDQSQVTFLKEAKIPDSIHKKYLKKTSSYKKQDALVKFIQFIAIDEGSAIKWTTPDKEFSMSSKGIEWPRRPTVYAEPNAELLEELMLVRTIEEADDLFDFNEALTILRS